MPDKKPSTTTRADTLKAERDRFVAFSFAAAGILLELDDAGVVSFVSGASSRLSDGTARPGATAVLNHPFLSHIAESDHVFVSALLKRISVGGKMTPVTVHFNGRDGEPMPAILGGCRLPTNPSVLYLTVTFISPGFGVSGDEESPTLPARQQFESVVERKLHHSLSMGQAVSLT